VREGGLAAAGQRAFPPALTGSPCGYWSGVMALVEQPTEPADDEVVAVPAKWKRITPV
jgi:hypothetical protein